MAQVTPSRKKTYAETVKNEPASSLEQPSNENIGMSNRPAEVSPSSPTLDGIQFRSTAVLGSGAFGVVTVGLDEKGDSIARKTIPKAFESLNKAKRTCREVTFLASFDHSNIVRFLGVDTLSSLSSLELSFFMEKMDTNLRSIIKDKSRILTLENVKLFVYQIFRGLKYLHSGNIIHRDLKPANLLVNLSNFHLKICDFGLSRCWVASWSEDVNLTFDVVTANYRAPELLMGNGKYTNRVDVWSVGCILAELMTRRPLFNSNVEEHLWQLFALLGCPSYEDMDSMNADMRLYMKWMPRFDTDSRVTMKSLSPMMDDLSLDLLYQLLAFGQRNRPSVYDALNHPFLEEGLFLFHSTCGLNDYNVRGKELDFDLEPKNPMPFDASFERKLARCNMDQIKERISNITSRQVAAPSTQQLTDQLDSLSL